MQGRHDLVYQKAWRTPMSRLLLVCSLCLWASLSLAASHANAASVNVVTVLTEHAWLAREIGGPRVKVKSFLTGKEDPHHVSARPSLILLASHADLFVSPGMQLDVGYTPLILRNSRNAKIQIGAKGYVDASQYVTKLQVLSNISRAMGDVHAQGNPHYHLDPIATLDAGRAILEGLKRVDPIARKLYSKRFQALRKEMLERLVGKILVRAAGVPRLEGLLRNYALLPFLRKTKIRGRPLIRYLGGWMKQMLPLRGQKLISYHRQWIYFLRRFGLQSIGQIEPKPGIPPSAKHLNSLLKLCRSQKPRWIIAASFFAAGSARYLAKRAKTSLLIVPFHVGGTANTRTYPALIQHLIDRFRATKGTP